MIVMTLEAVPPALRGELSRWLLEVQPGVYVGNGYAINASTYWGRVVRTTVHAVSVEARGTYYVTIIG